MIRWVGGGGGGLFPSILQNHWTFNMSKSKLIWQMKQRILLTKSQSGVGLGWGFGWRWLVVGDLRYQNLKLILFMEFSTDVGWGLPPSVK